MGRYKNQQDACEHKMTFFDTESVEFYLRCQPDKRYYQCPICNHLHLTTDEDKKVFDKVNVGHLCRKRDPNVVKVWSYDGDRIHEYLLEVEGVLLYAQTYTNSRGEKVKYIEVYDELTQKISDRMKNKLKRNGY